MMKLLSKIVAILLVILVGIVGFVGAQEEPLEPAVQQPQSIPQFPQLTSQENLQVVSIDLFEDPTIWDSKISTDYGITVHQRFEGSPSAKIPLNDAVVGGGGPVADNNVLGVKTEFIRRGFTEIVVAPDRPIVIPGIVKEVSVWVAGRELPHDLYFLFRDINGEYRKVYVDRLTHRGWKEMRAAIPQHVLTPNGFNLGIRQYNARKPLDTGLELVSIIIEPLFTEAYGSYYVYFDDMRASTDLSVFDLQSEDDIVDSW